MSEQARATLKSEQMRMEQAMRSNFVLIVLCLCAFVLEIVLGLWHGYYSVAKLAQLTGGAMWLTILGNALLLLVLTLAIINIRIYTKKLKRLEQSIKRSHT